MFPQDSEADASELPVNLKEMFPRYYIYSDNFSRFNPHNNVLPIVTVQKLCWLYFGMYLVFYKMGSHFINTSNLPINVILFLLLFYHWHGICSFSPETFVHSHLIFNSISRSVT